VKSKVELELELAIYATGLPLFLETWISPGNLKCSGKCLGKCK